MGRPRTEIGTYGEISVSEDGPPYIARTRFCLRNGRLKDVTRRGKTKAEATRRLKKALTKLADEVAGKKINGDTRFGHVMDLWLADLAEKVALGKRADKTLYDYRSAADNLRPEVGELACRDAENAGLMDETLKTVRRKAAGTKRGKSGEAAQLHARTVLSQTCGYAVRHGAMKVNPVKSIERIDREQDVVRALEPDERVDFLAKFRAECAARLDGPAKKGRGANRLGVRGRIWVDLPDMVEGMLSTGFRPGELLALTDEDVLLDEAKVTAFHHVVRIEKQGMTRVPKRKGNRPGLSASIVSWSAPMWRRRKLAATPGGPLFPTWNGQWQDPGNVAKKLREICDAIGYGWVSARYFRHTTATHLGDSDLTDTAISDALGNTPDVVRKHYRRPRQSNPAVAAALESMLDQ